MAEIVMPRLSDSMEEGTVLKWMKQVGDEVAVGDELVEIETDKANMAYESDVAGTLTQVLAQEGDTLAIGEPIAVVGDPEGSSVAPAGPATAGDPPLPPVAKASSATVPPYSATRWRCVYRQRHQDRVAFSGALLACSESRCSSVCRGGGAGFDWGHGGHRRGHEAHESRGLAGGWGCHWDLGRERDSVEFGQPIVVVDPEG